MDVRKYLKTSIFTAFLSLISLSAFAFHEGIYVTQESAENPAKLNYFISESKRVGIDSFVVDVNRHSKSYENGIHKIKSSGLSYVARVVIFPHGGNAAQVHDRSIWQKRLALMKYAVSLGADAIQLDYIRYNSKARSSKQNAKDIVNVIEYFRSNLPNDIQLQADIFGVAAHAPSNTIGQDAVLMSSTLDALCPMVYPSHYEPYRHYAIRPYQTVYNSTMALRNQLGTRTTRIYPWIELSNYRYPMSIDQKRKYIQAQIKATHDAGANGWYAWSPNNNYKILFGVM